MPRYRIASAGLLLAVGACTSVKSVQPAAFIPQHSPPVVWVTYTDNSFVPVAQPHMVGDTLRGTWLGLNEPLTIPLDEIQSVQARLPDHARTVILFTTLVVVTGGTAYLWVTAGHNGPYDPLLSCGTYLGGGKYTCWDQ